MIFNKLFKKISNDSQLKETLLKGSGTLGAKMFGLICSFLLGLLLARYYGDSGLGEYALAFSTVTLFSIIISFGNYPITVRYFALYPIRSKVLRKYILNVFLLIFSGWVILFLLINYCQSYIDIIFPIAHDKLVLLVPLILAFTIYAFVTEWLRGVAKPMLYSFFLAVAIPLVGVFLIGTNYIDFQFLQPSSPITVLSLSIYIAIGALVFTWLRILINSKPSCPSASDESSKFDNLAKLLIAGSPVLASQLITWSLSWVDQWAIGYFYNVGMVGIYFTAVKLSTLVGISIVALGAVVAPKIVKAHSESDREGLNQIIVNASYISLSVAVLMVLFFIFFAQPILEMYGTEFTRAKNALYILMLGQLVNTLTSVLGHTLEFTGNQKFFLKAVIIGGICNLILNIVLVPRWGLEGAAIATTLSLSLVNLLFLYYVRKIFKIKALPSWTLFKSLF